jgi:hypothetical protein
MQSGVLDGEFHVPQYLGANGDAYKRGETWPWHVASVMCMTARAQASLRIIVGLLVFGVNVLAMSRAGTEFLGCASRSARLAYGCILENISSGRNEEGPTSCLSVPFKALRVMYAQPLDMYYILRWLSWEKAECPLPHITMAEFSPRLTRDE